MSDLSIGIIGGGKGGTTLIETLIDYDNIVLDINPSAPV